MNVTDLILQKKSDDFRKAINPGFSVGPFTVHGWKKIGKVAVVAFIISLGIGIGAALYGQYLMGII